MRIRDPGLERVMQTIFFKCKSLNQDAPFRAECNKVFYLKNNVNQMFLNNIIDMFPNRPQIVVFCKRKTDSGCHRLFCNIELPTNFA